ncbi:MAG: cytochrome c oxidase subunit 3 [Bacteroidia bacterium]|nr:cytochrome c oxidase subunit 3 [Bacteroidia bacterium]
MTTDFKIVEEPKKPISMHPKKFALWLFIASVVMIFASLTSAYIVRQAEGNWLYFDLPAMFYTTSVVIILSSVSMQLAYWAAKKDQLSKVKNYIVITSILGIAFCVGQVLGWGELVASSVYLVGNPSGSFLYIITGLHAAHLISAIIFVIIVLIPTFRNKVHSGSLAQIEMCTTYWHFLGGLWLYLFVFLILNR